MNPSVAVVERRSPLRYRSGARPDLDRPAHVRAASGLVWWGRRLVVVQDDARFLGFVDTADGMVDDVALREGPAGRRVFDVGLGNKKSKPDFEVVFTLGDDLVVLGSQGPLTARQVAVWWPAGHARPLEVATHRLADALTERHLRPGTALNLEGGEVWDGVVVLGQRGGDRGAPDLLVRCDPAAFAALLLNPATAPIPETEAVEVAPGTLAGCPLHLTDLSVDGAFAAAAEATDSFYDDGPIAGSIVGHLRGDLVVWTAPVVDAAGEVTTDKVEGLAPADGPDRWWAVTDPDDPDIPGELLLLALR